MTRRRRHALAACGLTLALAVAAVAGLTLSGNSGTTAARSSGEMPTALGAHLAELSKAIPGTGGESAEGPGSAEEQEFAALAYPDTDVSLAKLQAMRAAGAALKGKFPKGKGSNGSWVSVGPSNALYPATQFRNSLSYVPAEYIGRRPHHLARHCADLQARQLPALARCRGRRRVAHEERAGREPELGVPVRLVRDPGDRLGRRRPERPVREHDLRGHRRGQRVRRLRRGRRALQVDERRRHVDGPHRSECVQRPRHRSDRGQARQPGHALRRHDPCRTRRGVGLLERRLGHPGRPEVGPLQVDGRRGELDVRPQRRSDDRAVHR